MKFGQAIISVLLALSMAVLSGCTDNSSLEHRSELVDLSNLTDGESHFATQVPYELWERGEFHIDESPNEDSLDLRGYDVRKTNLIPYRERLNDVWFNTETLWPSQLPEGFEPTTLLDLGKNPGLGIRELHEKGITGKGINIAIIDQALLLEHQEYANRIVTYDMIHCSDEMAQMHGSAVTSIAVGETVGVAPGAKVYYIASTFGTFYANETFEEDLHPMAEGINRVLEINEHLSKDEQIKVISISKGITDAPGATETLAAIDRAKEKGIFVITTSVEQTYGFILLGLGRDAQSDPDSFESYLPGMYWADFFYTKEVDTEPGYTLLVPMDARSYASSGSISGYEYCTSGGLSWSVPWLAGMYALCLEVNSELSFTDFIDLSFQTGKDITLQKQGERFVLGTIIDPISLIAELRK